MSLVDDAHALTAWNGRLYITSTGTDAVIVFDPDRGERVFWQANDRRKDTIHLNSLAVRQGRMVATAFGPKKSGLWRTADEGYLFGLNDNRNVCYPLFHPHSALATDRGILVCESRRGLILNDQAQTLPAGPGYLRGLAAGRGRLFAGSSMGRTRSRSTGRTLDDAAGFDHLADRCRILVFAWDRDDLSASELIDTIPLTHCGREIFDLLIL